MQTTRQGSGPPLVLVHGLGTATVHWFEHCGHFPMWDSPQEAVRVVLDATRSGA